MNLLIVNSLPIGRSRERAFLRERGILFPAYANTSGYPIPVNRDDGLGLTFLKGEGGWNLGQYRTNESVGWRMNFSSDVFGRFRRFTGGKSRNLPKADGGKGIVRRADELCGIALGKSPFKALLKSTAPTR